MTPIACERQATVAKRAVAKRQAALLKSEELKRLKGRPSSAHPDVVDVG
jgi:hypothetical protein